MRSLLAHIIVVAATCLFLGGRFLQAQSIPSGFTIICPPLSELEEQYDHEEQQPSGPKIVVTDIVLSGATQVTASEQREIAAAIKQQTSGYSVDAVTDEVVERVRAAWQDRGYFKVQVAGKKARIVSSRASAQRISVDVDVDEGLRYRLGEITFKSNTRITDPAFLRSMFPIKNGDIFSREKIAKGLDNLREAYSELGYLNFTSVPDTKFEDEKKLIFLLIDMDEGKQFYFSTIEILFLNDRTRQEVLKNAPIGQIYSRKLLDQFLEKYSAVFKLRPDDPRLTSRRLDENTGAVSITLYACPCPSC